MLRINQGEALALTAALGREWLEVNGRGGYASSTLLNCHTRKYHGLLVSRLTEPAGRYVLLSKLEDVISWGQHRKALSCHQYAGDFFPADRFFPKAFTQDIFPSFVYEHRELRMSKSILLLAEENSLLLRYDIEACPAPGILSLRPFLAFRDYHDLSRENPFLRGKTKAVKNGVAIRPYDGMPSLVMQTNLRPQWHPDPLWYRNFEYAGEAARGYPHHEDLFTPGVFRIPVRQGKTVIVYAALDPFFGRLTRKWDDEVRRRRQSAREDDERAAGLAAAMEKSPPAEEPAPGGCSGSVPEARQEAAAGRTGAGNGRSAAAPEIEQVKAVPKTGTAAGAEETASAGAAAVAERQLIRLLLQAGRRFLIRTPAGWPAVVAGYPWFGEWGRDTLISLPGLTFCSGRRREGMEILLRMARFERQGLLPNVFSERDADHDYNTVDAPLWFFWAVQQLLRDDGGVRMQAVVEKHLWPVLKNILRQFIHGAIFNIYMDDNGLLHAGAENRALTWMDACIDNHPVIPRHGYPVEINALWYNAVCFAAELSGRFGDREFYFDELIPKIRRSFQDTFWNEEDACLGDVFHQGRLDRSLRPNQIFAVSLPHSPLETVQGRLVVDKVRDELLTPVGIRSLSPRDPRYRGQYEGSPAARDGAYHQGTVWPWLLGPFGEAWLKVATNREEAKTRLRAHLQAFLSRHFREAGIGCVSEVFDGDAPHRPGGCIAQAWSTAELIRLYTLLGEQSSLP